MSALGDTSVRAVSAFACVLFYPALHELSHVVVAFALGVEVRGVSFHPIHAMTTLAPPASGSDLRFPLIALAGACLPLVGALLALLASKGIGASGPVKVLIRGIFAVAVLQPAAALILAGAVKVVPSDLVVLARSVGLESEFAWARALGILCGGILVGAGLFVLSLDRERGGLDAQGVRPKAGLRLFAEVLGALSLTHLFLRAGAAFSSSSPRDTGRALASMVLVFVVFALALLGAYMVRKVNYSRAHLVIPLALAIAALVGTISFGETQDGARDGIVWIPEAAGEAGDPFAKRILEAKSLDDRGRHEESVRVWSALHRASPTQPYLGIKLVRASFHAGPVSQESAEELLGVLEGLVFTEPNSYRSALHHWRGRIALATGDPSKACREFSRQRLFLNGTSLPPEDPMENFPDLFEDRAGCRSQAP